jgi:hypothetical protein
LLHAFVLVSCLAYSATLKMELRCPSDITVDFQRTALLLLLLLLVFIAGYDFTFGERVLGVKVRMYDILTRYQVNTASVQWVLGALSPGLRRPGREVDHSPPTSAEVKKMWIYTSTPHTPSWCIR